MKRIRQAWRVLWGEDIGTSYPYKFVQILNYQDKLLGLAGDGDIYVIETWPPYGGNQATVSLWLTNPVRP